MRRAMATSSTMSQTQRYAAGTLLALALRQAQIHQTVLLGSHDLDDEPPYPDPAAEPDVRDLWIHDSCGLVRPVLRFLEIDPKAWQRVVEKTAASSDPKHHIGAFLGKEFEDDGENACSDRPASGGGGSPAWCTKDYRKMAVLYKLLSACVADVNMPEDGRLPQRAFPATVVIGGSQFKMRCHQPTYHQLSFK